jgi:hypothetical protein
VNNKQSNQQWVNTCDRNPGNGAEVHIIQVDTHNNINRTTGRYIEGSWSIRNGSPPWKVVAWLESDVILTSEEAIEIPLQGTRTPYQDT